MVTRMTPMEKHLLEVEAWRSSMPDTASASALREWLRAEPQLPDQQQVTKDARGGLVYKTRDDALLDDGTADLDELAAGIGDALGDVRRELLDLHTAFADALNNRLVVLQQRLTELETRLDAQEASKH
jgi:hypothetical protein